MKVGDKIRLLDEAVFNSDYIGQIFTVTLNAGEMYELQNKEGIIQHYYPSWGTDCYEIVPEKDWADEAADHLDKVYRPETSQSARHNTGKTQVREVDPAFILGLGEVLTASRAKYEEGNWQKSTNFSTPYESCMRHLMKFWAGEELDNETNLDHLLHAATNLMFLYYHKSSGKGIDDRLFKKATNEKK